MRAFTYIDVAVQTFILCATVLFAAVTLIEGSVESLAVIAMYGAFFLGPWQLLSSVITCSLRGMFLKFRVIHLVSSVVYIAALWVVTVYNSFGEVVDVIGFAIPAALAVFHYNITVKSFRIIRTNTQTVPAKG